MPEDYFSNWQPGQKPEPKENQNTKPPQEKVPQKSAPPSMDSVAPAPEPAHQAADTPDGTFVSVWKNLWGLVVAPKKTIAKLKNHQKIVWLFTCTAVAYVVLFYSSIFISIKLAKTQVGLLYGSLEDNFNPFTLLDYFFGTWSGTLVGLIAIVLQIFVVLFGIIIAWSLITFCLHFWSVVYGGRKPFWTMGIFNFYLILLSVIVNIILLPIFLFTMGSGQGILMLLHFLLSLAAGIWFLVLFIFAVREYYDFSTKRAVLVVLTPIIICLIALVVMVGVAWNKGKDLTEGATRSLNQSSYNVVDNRLAPSDETDKGGAAQERVVMPIEKMQALNHDYMTTVTNFGKTLNSEDRRKINDMIYVKHYLNYYQEREGEYPKAHIEQWLDGETDIVNKELKNYFSTYFAKKDPKHPDYYYAYTSNGASFTLTCYLTGNKEVYKVTNE